MVLSAAQLPRLRRKSAVKGTEMRRPSQEANPHFSASPTCCSVAAASCRPHPATGVLSFSEACPLTPPAPSESPPRQELSVPCTQDLVGK